MIDKVLGPNHGNILLTTDRRMTRPETARCPGQPGAQVLSEHSAHPRQPPGRLTHVVPEEQLIILGHPHQLTQQQKFTNLQVLP